MAKQITIRQVAAGGIRTQGQIQGVWREEGVDFPLCVATVAGSAIIRRMRHHISAGRVQFDVALTSKKIMFFLDKAGAKSPFPQSAAAAISLVHIMHIALSLRLHQRTNRIGGAGRHQQVDMVVHQHPGVDAAFEVSRVIVQPLQVELVIFVGKKTGVAVVATLDDVKRDGGASDTGTTGHDVTLGQDGRPYNITK